MPSPSFTWGRKYYLLSSREKRLPRKNGRTKNLAQPSQTQPDVVAARSVLSPPRLALSFCRTVSRHSQIKPAKATVKKTMPVHLWTLWFSIDLPNEWKVHWSSLGTLTTFSFGQFFTLLKRTTLVIARKLLKTVNAKEKKNSAVLCSSAQLGSCKNSQLSTNHTKWQIAPCKPAF